MQFIHTHPIYPNKLCLYNEENTHNTYISYNWFLCGKPMCITKDNKKHEIIEIGDRSLFFEETTGNTYKIDVEKDPVKLLLLKSNTHNSQDLTDSISQGFQGVAYRTSQENRESNKSNNHDMVCSDVVLIFNKYCLQPSKRCPYTEFCSTHPDIHTEKNAPLTSRNRMLEYVKK